MEKFDIEKAKSGEYDVVTRDGMPVEIIRYDLNNNERPIAAIINDSRVCNYTLNGSIFKMAASEKDLFLKPKVKVGWINIYKTRNGFKSSVYAYDTEAMALRSGKGDFQYLKTIEIEH